MPSRPALMKLLRLAVTLVLLIQCLPQVDVFHRLPGGGFPALLLPVWQPLGNAVADVHRIRRQVDLAGLLEGAQRFDGSLQFHTVIGRIPGPTVQVTLAAGKAQQRSPTAGSGIPAAGAVGKDIHLLHAA